MNLTAKQEDILFHALGGSRSSNRNNLGFRWYYSVIPGCDGFDDCMAMVEMGVMTQSSGYFFVTKMGADLVGVTLKRG